jgi:hypothetical protein
MLPALRSRRTGPSSGKLNALSAANPVVSPARSAPFPSGSSANAHTFGPPSPGQACRVGCRHCSTWNAAVKRVPRGCRRMPADSAAVRVVRWNARRSGGVPGARGPATVGVGFRSAGEEPGRVTGSLLPMPTSPGRCVPRGTTRHGPGGEGPSGFRPPKNTRPERLGGQHRSTWNMASAGGSRRPQNSGRLAGIPGRRGNRPGHGSTWRSA